MEQDNKKKKKPYTTPRIVVLGDIEAITLGAAHGSLIDVPFPVGPPRRDLTFGS